MWNLIDEKTGQRVRGPYSHAETTVAVRQELELRYPDKEWNLQIINDDPNIPDDDFDRKI